MTAKQQVLEVVNSLPDDCTMDEIRYNLFVRHSIEMGLKDIEEGRVLSQEEMRKRAERWLASSGHKQP